MNDSDRKKLAMIGLLDLLAEKRTSYTMLKAGIFSTTVPLSFMGILVPQGGIAFSPLLLVTLSLGSALLMVMGGYLVIRSAKNLAEFNKRREILCCSESSLRELIH